MLKVILRSLAALAVLAATSFALSGQAVAQPTASASLLAKARRATDLVNPFDVMLRGNMAGWEAAARRSLQLDPTAQKLEVDYPGVLDAGIAAARPVAREFLEKSVRQATERKAQHIASRLTAGELDEAIRFFESEVGRKAIRGLHSNMDIAGLADEIAERRASTGKGEVTPADAAAAESEAGAKMLAQVTAAEQVAILRFSQSLAGRKFSGAAREADVLILEMVNAPDPAFLARQQEAVNGGIRAFIESRKTS